MKLSLKAIFVSMFAMQILVGCSVNKVEDLLISDPQALYIESVALVEKEDFNEAIKNFEAIERDFPSSEWALKSNITRAYAFYTKGDFIESIFAAEDFIKKYPAHAQVDYLYYLKALAEYDQIVDTERDQRQTEKAKKALDELILKYPSSKYIPDARQKRLYAYNLIAGKNMSIARLYLEKGRLIPALLRYRFVVMSYDDSIFVEEALYRLVEIHHAMGIDKDAFEYAAVLGYNYPASVWYSKAYNLIQSSKK